ncbi:hypothetical protein BV22DRAFT_92448 [Leucogyrophana mollusca]|uniref:Uncharacterized protein n=1 Tax=Leucogyrophana mollusca TaxID=85980 RepID=A0ACB8BWC4_9AGAM|nr:hypothetical protein BV22DRAFT_92448 [Leucogyrophana mollusca]
MHPLYARFSTHAPLASNADCSRSSSTIKPAHSLSQEGAAVSRSTAAMRTHSVGISDALRPRPPHGQISDSLKDMDHGYSTSLLHDPASSPSISPPPLSTQHRRITPVKPSPQTYYTLSSEESAVVGQREDDFDLCSGNLGSLLCTKVVGGILSHFLPPGNSPSPGGSPPPESIKPPPPSQATSSTITSSTSVGGLPSSPTTTSFSPTTALSQGSEIASTASSGPSPSPPFAQPSRSLSQSSAFPSTSSSKPGYPAASASVSSDPSQSSRTTGMIVGVLAAVILVLVIIILLLLRYRRKKSTKLANLRDDAVRQSQTLSPGFISPLVYRPFATPDNRESITSSSFGQFAYGDYGTPAEFPIDEDASTLARRRREAILSTLHASCEECGRSGVPLDSTMEEKQPQFSGESVETSETWSAKWIAV